LANFCLIQAWKAFLKLTDISNHEGSISTNLSAFLDRYQYLSVFEWQTTHVYICKHTDMGEWKGERESV